MSLPSSQGKTILVCDDDRLVLLSITSALRQAGYQVIETDNGDDAILLARQHRPSLAILDIAMDGKTGLDVAAYLRDYVDLPFMFLSAYGGDEEVQRGLSFGAIDYLVKPIETNRLLSRLQRALDLVSEVATSKRVLDSEGGHMGEAAPPANESETVQRWVAAGIIMAREGISLAHALRRLNQLALERSHSAHQVALEIVASTVAAD
ncbi:MAG: response regulator [Burkholderiaceae bacterium]